MNRHINVLFIDCVSYLGGAEQSILQILPFFKHIRPIFAIPNNGDLKQILIKNSIEVIPISIGPLKKTLNPLLLCKQLIILLKFKTDIESIIKTYSPDLIYAN